jgi:hypothetical protein
MNQDKMKWDKMNWDEMKKDEMGKDELGTFAHWGLRPIVDSQGARKRMFSSATGALIALKL